MQGTGWRRPFGERPLGLVEAAALALFLWPVLGLLGAVPFCLAGLAPLDAFFEAVSALSGTGLSCFSGELLPGVLLFQSLLNWAGAFLELALLVTVLPQVGGCFGLSLVARQSFAFSPVWRRLRRGVWRMLLVFASLSALFFCVYLAAGLSPLVALVLALKTISLSGTGTDFFVGVRPALLLVGMLLMLVAGGNFLLYYRVAERRRLSLLAGDAEARAALLVFLGAGAIVSLHLAGTGTLPLGESLRQGFFAVASFFSTAGFAGADFALFPDFDKYLLLLLALVGGSLGSAAGGLKLVRFLVLLRLTAGELRRTIHPHMVVAVRLDGLAVPDKVVGRMLALFFLYVLALLGGLLLFAAAGLALLPALGLAAGCLSGTGALFSLLGGAGVLGLGPGTKLLAVLYMVLGRGGIFAALLLLGAGMDRIKRGW